MIIIEKSHPAVISVVHRILTKANNSLITAVKDFDDVTYKIKVSPVITSFDSSDEISEELNDGKGVNKVKPFTKNEVDKLSDLMNDNLGRVTGARGKEDGDLIVSSISASIDGDNVKKMIKASITVILYHVVPFKILNMFHNYEEVLSPLFPPNVLIVNESYKDSTIGGFYNVRDGEKYEDEKAEDENSEVEDKLNRKKGKLDEGEDEDEDEGTKKKKKSIKKKKPKYAVCVKIDATNDKNYMNFNFNLGSNLSTFLSSGANKKNKKNENVSDNIANYNAKNPPRDQILALASQLRVLSYCPIFIKQAQLYAKNPQLVLPIRIPYRNKVYNSPPLPDNISTNTKSNIDSSGISSSSSISSSNENMYIFVNKKGDFYVVISIIIDNNKDEQLFVRNFLQSFADAKRLEKSIAAAPGFFFCCNTPPLDLINVVNGNIASNANNSTSSNVKADKDSKENTYFNNVSPITSITEPASDSTFWCVFQLSRLQLLPISNVINVKNSEAKGTDGWDGSSNELPPLMASYSRLHDTVKMILNFRHMLLYHISCCRSYMHTLMRKRVNEALTILNK